MTAVALPGAWVPAATAFAGPFVAWVAVLGLLQLLPRALDSVARDARAVDLERLRLFEAALASSGDGIIIVAPVSPDIPTPRIVYANSAFEQLTGYDPTEAVGQSPTIFPEADSLEGVRAALRATSPTCLELPSRRKDGTRVWAEWQIVPVQNPDGQITHWVAVLRDTTDRRGAQEEVRQAGDFLTSVLENIPVPVAVRDGRDRYLFVNHAGEKCVRVERSNAIGKTAAELLPREVATADASQAAAVRKSGKSVREERAVDYGRGARVLLRVAFPIPGSDARVAAVGEVSVDLTDQKRAEDAVRALNAELKHRVEEAEAIIDLSPVGIAVVNDSFGQAVEVNQALRNLLGLPPETDPELTPAATRLRVKFRHGGQDVPHAELPMQRCLARGEVIDGVEFEVTLPDGQDRFLVNSVRPLLGDNGRVRGCVSVYTDITERVRMVRALQESEERFRRIFEDSPIGIYRAAPDGKVFLVNPAALRMMGCHAVADFPIGWSGDLDAAGAAEQPDREEFSWQRPDGRVVTVTANTRPVRGVGGEVLYYEGTLEDVTQSRHAEQQLREREALLRSVIGHIPCGVFWKNRDGVYLGCNDQVARDHGLSGPDQAVGQTDFDIGVASSEAAADRDCDQQVIDSGLPIMNLEVVRTRPGGAQVSQWVSRVPLRDASGRVIGVLGAYQDITERKRLEEQFRQAQKMDAIGRLAGGIAHDFNNLLTVILGNADLLDAHLPSGPEATELLDELRGAGERAAGLVRQLLTFSRRQPSRPEVVDLNEVIAGLAGMLRRLLGERVSVATSPSPTPVRVKVDRGQLEQVLVNLAVNARDAMPGGGTLTINTSLFTGADGRVVCLEVSDTGTGMSDEVRAKIFEPFFTTKGPDKGTGLGLATVFGIVKQAGGDIVVDSALGRGTTFRVELPWCDTPPSPSTIFTMNDMMSRRLTGLGRTVLLVEDEDGVRKFARSALESQGYTVVEAVDAETALELLKPDLSLDLLVTDLTMPGMDGSELAGRVKVVRPGIGIVFTSGYVPDDERLGLPESVFLSKPFTLGELLQATSRAVGKSLTGVGERALSR